MQKKEVYLSKDGAIPNNDNNPVKIYSEVFTEDIKESFRSSFEKNGWSGIWTNGIYDYHHYHSNAFEALGIISGNATLIIGGPGAETINVSAGDLLILPPGIGHCMESSSEDFSVIGAYPKGQEDYDICTEKDDPEVQWENIRSVPKPTREPV